MVLNKGWKSPFSAYTLCHQKHSTSLPLVSFDMGMKHRFCLDYRSIHNTFHFFSLFIFDVFHANFGFLMKKIIAKLTVCFSIARALCFCKHSQTSVCSLGKLLSRKLQSHVISRASNISLQKITTWITNTAQKFPALSNFLTYLTL